MKISHAISKMTPQTSPTLSLSLYYTREKLGCRDHNSRRNDQIRKLRRIHWEALERSWGRRSSLSKQKGRSKLERERYRTERLHYTVQHISSTTERGFEQSIESDSYSENESDSDSQSPIHTSLASMAILKDFPNETTFGKIHF